MLGNNLQPFFPLPEVRREDYDLVVRTSNMKQDQLSETGFNWRQRFFGGRGFTPKFNYT